MVFAEVISAKGVKGWQDRGFLPDSDEISCECCSLNTYSIEDYKILYVGKKLAYFMYPEPSNPSKIFILCHDCLFKKIKKEANGKEINLILLDEENEHVCKFTPEELIDEADAEEWEDGKSGDDWKKNDDGIDGFPFFPE